MKLRRTAAALCAVYVSVPVLLYLFPWILGHVVFSHLLRLPFFVHLCRPEDVLNHTLNFYLDTEDGVSLGVWHTLPLGQWEEAAGKSPEWHQDTLGDGRPVIIYLHGNIGTRALPHRVELVKVLSAAGFHVLSLDYRGFGDSSGEPSEAGLTSDAVHLHRWVKQRSGRSLVVLWGHSLGSGVASNAAVKLQKRGAAVDALILESPYTKIGHVILNHWITQLYNFLPGFESLLWNILEMNNISFANDENLRTSSCPLLILHAKDDRVVPYDMGVKLYEISQQRTLDTGVPVEMVSYRADLGYAHSNIYEDPDLPAVVRKFLQNVGH